MKHLVPFAIALTLASPLHAKDQTLDDLFKQFEDLSEQAQTMMESWMTEMAPTLEGLADKIGDLSTYHPPEILENGDIIIRRKTPLPVPETPRKIEPMTKDKGAIDL